MLDGELACHAAERLSMSSRQVRRLVRNRPSNRRLKEDLESQVAWIVRDHYPDFGPTQAIQHDLLQPNAERLA